MDSVIDYYIKGGVSGMFGIVLSHPIDSIKTHIQTGNKLSSFNPTIRNFYKGVKSPLLGVGIETSLVFGTYNYCKNIQKYPIMVSGAISGLIASCIVSPYERLKILQQTNKNISFYNTNIQFWLKGLGTTFTREVPGFAIYFSVYEKCKSWSEQHYNTRISYTESFLYGGLSGVIAWIFIYPQDRIKTILQSNTNSSGGGNSGNNNKIKVIIREIYNNGGFKNFYNGFQWAILRAMLLHSGTFVMMEILNY